MTLHGRSVKSHQLHFFHSQQHTHLIFAGFWPPWGSLWEPKSRPLWFPHGGFSCRARLFLVRGAFMCAPDANLGLNITDYHGLYFRWPAISSQRGPWPQNRGSKLNASPDGVWIGPDSILVAQMAPKSKPRGVQTRCLEYTSLRSTQTSLLQALFLHCQHCEDAI